MEKPNSLVTVFWTNGTSEQYECSNSMFGNNYIRFEKEGLTHIIPFNTVRHIYQKDLK